MGVPISSVDPDWGREAKSFWSWQPSRSLLAAIRAWQSAQALPWPLKKIVGGVAVLRHRFWSVVTGADIPVTSKIGGGLVLPHPNGVVIHPGAQIGVNCIIFQQVTIGWARGGLPTVAGEVEFGAGAKVIGPVHIGAHARIGANAVVLIDVPERGVAVGCPARINRMPFEGTPTLARFYHSSRLINSACEAPLEFERPRQFQSDDD
jgi:serine O-acetyltransferase